MPIVNVEIVLRPQEKVKDALAGELANALGKIFGTAPQETWVIVKTVEPHRYAENDATQSYYPVFARVMKGALPEMDILANEADRLSQAIGALCDRPQARVHIIYEPPALGRIAFGGKLTGIN